MMQRGEHHHPRHMGVPGGGATLSVPVLALAAALVTAIIMLLSDWTVHATRQVDCSAFSSFLDRRHQHAHVQQMLAETAALPAAQQAAQQAGAAAAAAGPGLLPASAAALGGVAADAMRRVGWRSGVKFARFDGSASMDAVLDSSLSYTGAYLLIVPGNGSLQRRSKGTPFFSLDTSAAASLTPVLSPAAAALNAAAGVLEKALGRRLFPFRLETAALAACSAEAGPCAVWEASSGRLVLDSWLTGQMAAADGAGGEGGADTEAANLQAGQVTKKQKTAAGEQDEEAGGDAELASPAAAAEEGDEEAAAASDENQVEGAEKAEAAEGASGAAGGGSSDGSELGKLLGAFVETLAEQAAEASSLLKKGKASLPVLAAVFARAGATSVALLMASHVPLWWCIACPLVLGMLAPFLFNFGLTAAAEALCSQLHLPDDTCADLWWGAFAVALMLSLASAIPIVYLCRLPECGRRAAAAAGGALAAAVAS